jgi:hypothetical protein
MRFPHIGAEFWRTTRVITWISLLPWLLSIQPPPETLLPAYRLADEWRVADYRPLLPCKLKDPKGPDCPWILPGALRAVPDHSLGIQIIKGF